MVYELRNRGKEGGGFLQMIVTLHGGGFHRPPKVIYGPPDTIMFFILVPAQVEAR